MDIVFSQATPTAEWEEQGARSQSSYIKMTLLPHGAILYFNPQVYLWQTLHVEEALEFNLTLLQWFAVYLCNWNCLMDTGSDTP